MARFTDGQHLYLIPGRWWETDSLIDVTIVGDQDLEIGQAFVFHAGYGHNVYVHRSNVFATTDEALAEIARRRESRDAEIEAEGQHILHSILASL